ncbi:MAG: biopolymer transporter ExbD [Prosthecobacter sp.]|uniref:ExbD/TolR family protein n=1 Tax=Prosthecobacter sp. TaxID=1965333 RepID=UPI00262051C5|nr:biopolymer transporter ExbD [Prosthecobacter sp.]MCF7789817.1 biopolymer transporter ExbD [Prosthecobacter sp.]
MDADNKSYDDINVTPMVDLYLVLLLIFIIMTTAGVQGVKVNLPRGGPSTSKPIEGPKMQAITVDNAGNIKLNALTVTIDELSSKLEAIKASMPDVPVVIRGDSGTQYQTIMDVLTAVGRSGITNIGLATQAKK